MLVKNTIINNIHVTLLQSVGGGVKVQRSAEGDVAE